LAVIANLAGLTGRLLLVVQKVLEAASQVAKTQFHAHGVIVPRVAPARWAVTAGIA
jgi:hypothetical protein